MLVSGSFYRERYFYQELRMEFEWDYSTGKVNFIELSELYKIAPLGEKMRKI